MTPAARALLPGILAMLGAVALFATMDAIVKHIQADYGTVQIFFFRSLFALLPLILIIRAEGGLATLRPQRPLGHLAYSLLMMGFLLVYFYALQLLSLADAYAISFAAPLFITALAVPLLGETVGPQRWAAVLVGFLGVVVILRPGAGVLTGGGLLALASTVLYAFAMIRVRLLGRTEKSGAIVLYFSVIGAATAGLLMLAGSAGTTPASDLLAWHPPSGAGWLWLISTGLLGGFGQVLITRAYRLTPAAVVSPFQYSSMLWALFYGLVVFGDRPDLTTLLGSAVVMASGLYILHRETRRSAAPAAETAP
jgi:drug/metabolite transporter (DMT)-like permease